jgi:hypothetical protein
MSERFRIMKSNDETLCARCAKSRIIRDELSQITEVICVPSGHVEERPIKKKVFSCSGFRNKKTSEEDYKTLTQAYVMEIGMDGTISWKQSYEEVRVSYPDGSFREMNKGKMVRYDSFGMKKTRKVAVRRGRSGRNPNTAPPDDFNPGGIQ